jgi:hypothetical protein
MSAAIVTSKNVMRCQWWRGRTARNTSRMTTRRTLIIDKVKCIYIYIRKFDHCYLYGRITTCGDGRCMYGTKVGGGGEGEGRGGKLNCDRRVAANIS